MQSPDRTWDYLIVTASNDEQADAYRSQLGIRRELGLLSGFRELLVVADPDGKRVGSGGSTVCCLMEVLERELPASKRSDEAAWRTALEDLRILIIHAGGDSKRLPAYGPCGKLFVPVPGESDCILGMTLFDRLIETRHTLPAPTGGGGQVVITAGDALLRFDCADVRFEPDGITALGYYTSPEEASKHGVLCTGSSGEVRHFLQKPSRETQRAKGAVDRYGRTVLDLGVMSFDAETAVALLELCGAASDSKGAIDWRGPVGDAAAVHSIDFFREICCALGTETSQADYVENVQASGSTWGKEELRHMFNGLSGIPLHVQVLSRCSFLHFGTLRQLVTSGLDLLHQDRDVIHPQELLIVNSEVAEDDQVSGARGWVEGCRINANVEMGQGSLLVGLDVSEPVTIPPGVCIDTLRGRTREGHPTWFMRCFHVDDSFKDSLSDGAQVWGVPLADLPRLSGEASEDIWDDALPNDARSLWNARLFPALAERNDFHSWLWLLKPSDAGPERWKLWGAADRYSLEEIALLADHEDFYGRRAGIRVHEVFRVLSRMMRPASGLSAAELAFAAEFFDDPADWLAALVREAHRYYLDTGQTSSLAGLGLSRIIHTIGSALDRIKTSSSEKAQVALVGLEGALDSSEFEWLVVSGLDSRGDRDTTSWVGVAKQSAFEHISHVMSSSTKGVRDLPKSALRKDEIVWGRAPARLELSGGWTDTPPYSLERGGCLLNSAIDLNGQPPIQAYARVIDEPVIRLASIDFGQREEITQLDQLLDYRHATSGFSLPKAALALSGFSPETAPWPDGVTLQRMLEDFGGGIELTTLAAIPSGSGLGTSSVVGAVVLAVVQRVMGRTLTQRELFHAVLLQEQILTTGGGWQDQIGGAVPGTKLTTTQPDLVPDPMIHFVPSDVLDPRSNGGCTLLYYTGITRLAKNVLQAVVGRYLDRDRSAMATMRRIHSYPSTVADTMARKDLQAFGHALSHAWELATELSPGSSNPEIESLMARVRPHVYGARILGAGDGGFLVMVCKSPEDARSIRSTLESEPSNHRARFFDFGVSAEGLVVTVC